MIENGEIYGTRDDRIKWKKEFMSSIKPSVSKMEMDYLECF